VAAADARPGLARQRARGAACQPSLIARSLVVAATLLVALAGCGEEVGDPPPEMGSTRSGSARAGTPRIHAARCPADAANCAWAVGRVIYIESVDPDGDGDLHVVATRLRGSDVTGGGLVVFDVNTALRPKRDPQPGDVVTGAGPVYEGSFGQRQIEVDEFRTARGRG
jgi:hypothetical protein